MTTLLAVDDLSFRRHVLGATLPTVVCFRAPGCAASQALRPMLRRLAARYAGRLVVAEIDGSRAQVADQFGVTATPTLLVFRYGNEVLRSVGFLPEGLLTLLFDDALDADSDFPRLWVPIEERFEDAAIVPLLDALGLAYERQVACPTRPGAAARGRIDVLVRDATGALTLLENKRVLRSNADLRAATVQGSGYARAARLPSFVVAAPVGLWVYALHGAHALLDREFSWADLHTTPVALRETLLALRANSRHEGATP